MHKNIAENKNELDFFGLRSSKDLHEEIRKIYVDFYKAPDDTKFLLIIFALNHLREWIAESNCENIQKKIKTNETLTEAEKFFDDIWKMPEFRIINSLCNRGKHYITKSDEYKTNVLQGLRCDIGRCGDTLDQIYFLVDGIDVRDIFSKVFQRYDSWFKKINGDAA